MKSIDDPSTCTACNQKIDKGVEIEKNDAGKWVHSVCPGSTLQSTAEPAPQEAIISDSPIEIVENVDPYKDCILGCVRAAEFFKSIDYPKELWNLSTIWNTERIKKK